MTKPILLTALLIYLVFGGVASAAAQIAEGGAFTLQKSVTASGGEKSANIGFSVENTSGQSIAGQSSSSGAFQVYAGFWTPEAIAPTAADAELGGRVLTADGRGIRNALVSLINSRGEMRTMMTGNSGRYRFVEAESGASYIVRVTSKRFVFGNPSQIIALNESRDDIDFVADPQ